MENISPNGNNNKDMTITTTTKASLIPSYQQQNFKPQQQPNIYNYNSNKQRQQKDDNSQQQTYLPQPITTFPTNSMTSDEKNRFRTPSLKTALDDDDDDGGGGSGGGFVTDNADKQQHIMSEMQRLYRKSPFLARKYSNNGHNNNNNNNINNHNNNLKTNNDNNTKKENTSSSMFSSIGQSIIRNLTTSPFSQKRQHSVPQPHQVEPLWRRPIAGQEVASAFADHNDNNKDMRHDTLLQHKTNFMGSASPAMTRHRFQIDEHKPSQIPVGNRSESPLPTRANNHGNQSPIVLQRFYHQQNQMREREIERRLQQQQQQQIVTNPFLSDYGAMSGTSSQSTSSQSSTQSTSSQIAMEGLEQRLLQTAATPTPSPPAIALQPQQHHHHPFSSNATASSAFGVNGGHLQYQPLPAQYVSPTYNGNITKTPTSPDHHKQHVQIQQQSPTSLIGEPSAIDGGTNVLNKFYVRRQLSSGGSSSSGSGSSSGLYASTLSPKNEQQQQHANNLQTTIITTTTATPTTTTPTPTITAGGSRNGNESIATMANKGHVNTMHGHRRFNSGCHYYQRSSSVGADHSNLSSTTTANSSPSSPTKMPKPRFNNYATDFYEQEARSGGSGTFLRRYAAASAASGCAGSCSPTPQHLSGLDRRHRSPEPPPRYNRGQSPLLLRKNLLELSGQPITAALPPGCPSPMHNRRYVTASPPLPPPRRSSESVPNSPQHFRTRIHYTPEPQRRIYRTIDQ